MWAAVLGALALLALWFPGAVLRQSFSYPWGRTWWLCDDAMISMVYARNLAGGQGLVWNAGERVEGFSNFLWTLFMALFHGLGLPDSQTALPVILLAISCAAACVPLILGIVGQLGGGGLAALIAVLGFVLDDNSAFLAAGGMENALFTLLFLWALSRILGEAGPGGSGKGTWFLVGLLALVRTDGLVHGVILAAAGLAALPQKAKYASILPRAFLLPIPFAVYEVFRLVYYEDFLSNTAYLKGTWWEGKLITGGLYLVEFARDYPGALLLAVPAVFLGDRLRRSLGLILAGGFAYALATGGDFFDQPRYLIHLVPLLWVLAGLTLERLIRDLRLRVALAALLIVSSPVFLPRTAFLPYESQFDRGNVEIGLLLRLNALETSTVADFWAGNTLYFSRRKGVDLLGKCDGVVSHVRAAAYGRPGHNKFNYAHSLGVLKPDFIVAPWQEPVQSEKLDEAVSRGSLYIPAFYTDPEFRTQYLGQAIPLSTWRTIFVRGDSPEVSRRMTWTGLGTDRVRDSLGLK